MKQILNDLTGYIAINTKHRTELDRTKQKDIKWKK